MYLSRLVLDDFRSWKHCLLDCEPGVTVLQGSNGLGKTNLVEAIEVLSTGTSHRVSSSLPLIRRGGSAATIRANVISEDSAPHRKAVDERIGTSGTDAGELGRTTTYEATINARGANRARINGGNSLYLRDIVGRFPSITFAPEDQRLVSADPAVRRRFIDHAGALLQHGYADCLQRYVKVAKQRTALLKGIAERDGDPSSMNELEIWTGQLIETGIELTRARAAVMGRISVSFGEIYRDLAGTDDLAGVEYAPSFLAAVQDDNPIAAISARFQRIYPGEVARGQNLIGPHRDDMTLTLNGMPAREFASNGEMWTMALALRISLFNVVTEEHGKKPVVILDDVFAQLDSTRRRQILDFALRQPQVFITVAAAGDIPETSGARIIDVANLAEADVDDHALLVERLMIRRTDGGEKGPAR